ncbi:hypothetical protein Cob_v006599 [Colletotrichum orbiculare MAFF 240422]|uniref:Uncharacterized protein n=1 Tax=Colletotrichum orbiculare (strain 104-T / ATCC 96160 / CBS 514.97 / LARS 414 / MAFF 240422) TaxID=1213857 RepID=A0A484FQ02_COLOR|nr:hypothetical protein Cob_v006599 [Colletotrichum orbiculare MAFF 240422]
MCIKYRLVQPLEESPCTGTSRAVAETAGNSHDCIHLTANAAADRQRREEMEVVALALKQRREDVAEVQKPVVAGPSPPQSEVPHGARPDAPFLRAVLGWVRQVPNKTRSVLRGPAAWLSATDVLFPTVGC